MTTAWYIPRIWLGETVFILGGGLSLAGFDATVLRSRRVIAVNEAGLSLAPWCDVLFWPDARWLEWNFNRITQHTGQFKITRMDPYKRTTRCDPDLKERITEALPSLGVTHLERERGRTLSTRRSHVAGLDGGTNAVNIAFHFGAPCIVLLGFDMRDGNFHDRHISKPIPGCYESFARSLTQMGKALEKHNVEVLNATVGSALTCFPKVRLEDVI